MSTEESESRCPSRDSVRASIIRSISTDHFRLGRFCCLPFKVHLRTQQRNMESLFCCVVGYLSACCPTHFEPLRLSKQSDFSVVVLGILAGSAQKPQ